MEKVSTVIEIPGDKKVNIATFYLTGETNIWWNTVKNRPLGTDFTWSRIAEELTTPLRIAKWELTNVCGVVAKTTIVACSWRLKAVDKGSHLQGPQL